MSIKNQFFHKGQGIVEYILITALVSLAAMAIFRTFRADIQEAYDKAGKALIQTVDEGLDSDQGNE